MLNRIFNFLIRGKKQKYLPCEYKEWGYNDGRYEQRYCKKCSSRQVRIVDSHKLMESHCGELGKNTFYNYEK